MSIKLAIKVVIIIFFAFCPHYSFGQDENNADRKSYLTQVQISDADKLKVFNNVWETVDQRYFDPTFNGNDWMKIREIYQPQALAAKDKVELVDVLNKMLGELKTSHMSVSFEIGIGKGTLKKFFGEKIDYKQNDILYGYGFSTIKFGESSVITEVDKTSSADEAGIKPGWLMNSCQNKSLSKQNGNSLIHTEFSNCIFVTETGQEKALTLNKSFYLKPGSIAQRISKLLTDNILYLKFDSFDDGTAKWLKKEVNDNFSAKAIIIDIRGNQGGYFGQLKDSLSLFFPLKTVVGTSIERDLDEKVLRVGSDNFYKGKIAVLIDENSFSAAEIFASAFQESGRGKIIGQKSTGQVLAGITKGLSNDLELFIAVRDYKTAKDFRLEGNGVTPDFEIPLTIEDFRKQHDTTLEKALEILKSQP